MTDWLADLLGVDALPEGARVDAHGQPLVVRDGIPRAQAAVTDSQAATGEAFGFKWAQEDTFSSKAFLDKNRAWFVERYGEPAEWEFLAEDAVLVDAGCGAGVAGLELFRDVLARIRYLGVDLTDAVDVAARRFAQRGAPGRFLQADLTDLPLAPATVDVIFSEGVLHHTDSTEGAIAALAPLLRPGGRLVFYVYRRKGPVREFTDDHVRAWLQTMPPQQGWEALKPLTKLGIALGELEAEVDVPEAVEPLGIPAGRIDVQRLFYWSVAKAFYAPEMSFDEMHHLNYDWYAPVNAHRQSEQEVRVWCEAAGLEVEDVHSHLAGLTVRARRR